MADVKIHPRRYDASRRRAQAAESRRQVLRHARDLFVHHGYAATSVTDIATAAGVGRRTIYDAFGSKLGLLLGILEELAPLEQTRFQDDLRAAAGDPVRQVRLAVEFVTTLYTAASDVLAMVHAAAGAEPDLAVLDREGERRRLAGQRTTVEDWDRRGFLRPGLDVDRAADVLWALTSPWLFRTFVVDRGWRTDDYCAWLRDQLVGALLVDRWTDDGRGGADRNR